MEVLLVVVMVTVFEVVDVMVTVVEVVAVEVTVVEVLLVVVVVFVVVPVMVVRVEVIITHTGGVPLNAEFASQDMVAGIPAKCSAQFTVQLLPVPTPLQSWLYCDPTGTL